MMIVYHPINRLTAAQHEWTVKRVRQLKTDGHTDEEIKNKINAEKKYKPWLNS